MCIGSSYTGPGGIGMAGAVKDITGSQLGKKLPDTTPLPSTAAAIGNASPSGLNLAAYMRKNAGAPLLASMLGTQNA